MSRFLVSLSLAAFSLSSLATTYLTSGYYYNDPPWGTIPMLAQSFDEGQTWNMTEIPGLEAKDWSYFNTATCTASLCIAAGFAHPDVENGLLLQSQDGGYTWNFVTLGNSGEVYSFWSSTCSGSSCTLMGATSWEGHPMIAQTTDAGNTWNLINLGDILPGINWADIDCNENYCAAVGYDSLGGVVAQSFDKGKTWAQVHLKGMYGGMFFKVDCSTDSCYAAGYNMHKEENVAIPLLVKSSADKSQWAIQEIQGGVVRAGSLSSVACNESTCVASGATYTGKILLATSKNGSPWVYEHLGFAREHQGLLVALDCNSQSCVAVGSYSPEKALIISNISGSWMIENINQSGFLYYVSCDDTLCVAGGRDAQYKPLLMQATSGKPWSKVSIENIPGSTGVFTSGSGTSSGPSNKADLFSKSLSM